MRETVTATSKATMNVSVSVSGEASNGPLLRAFDSDLHRADREMTTVHAVNVQVSSRQMFHQCVCSPPPALP